MTPTEQRLDEPESFAELVKLITDLPEKHRSKLSSICFGDDTDLDPQIARDLHNKSLIEYGHTRQFHGFSIPKATPYSHRTFMEWCQWCENDSGHEEDFPDSFRNQGRGIL